MSQKYTIIDESGSTAPVRKHPLESSLYSGDPLNNAQPFRVVKIKASSSLLLPFQKLQQNQYIAKAMTFILFILAVANVTGSAIAQEEDDNFFLHQAGINNVGRQDIDARLKPLGFGLMGDSIDPFTGTLVFNQTDILLPGNSTLEVAIRRSTSTSQKTNRQEMFLANWRLEVPSISMLVAKSRGWETSRCTDRMSLPEDGFVSGGGGITYSAQSFWDGLKLNIPGKGTTTVIEPPNGRTFTEARWAPHSTNFRDANYLTRVTKDHWVLTCIDRVKVSTASGQPNNSGQGFIATSPDGTKYKLDRLIYRAADAFDPRGTGAYELSRDMATLYATEVTDVNGNWVRYSYSTDGKLTRIYSSDGRSITLTYVSGTKNIASATANGRTWRYTYRNVNRLISGEKVGMVLHKVIQPDGKYWEYGLDYLTTVEPNAGHYCNPDENAETYVKHPYGMQANYTLGMVRQRKQPYEGSGIPSVFWRNIAQTCSNGEYVPRSTGRFPKTVAVKQKKLSGPSVSTSTWNYEYEEYKLNTPWSSLDKKTTTVIDSAGNRKVSHMYRDDIREGLLARYKKYDSDGRLLEEEILTHVNGSKMGNIEGLEEMPFNTAKLLTPTYVSKVVTKRNGDTYSKEYKYDTNPTSSSYSYGNPISIKTYSNVSTTPRSELINYIHKKNHWVIGLLLSSKVNGRNTKGHGYDSFGRVLSTYKEGTLFARYRYHQNTGMVASVEDGSGLKTEVLNYYRGMPRVIKRADGNKDYLSVDSNGWVVGYMDFRGYTTRYKHDNMGRLTKITPSQTQKNWLPTNISYSFGNEITQTIKKGDNEKIIKHDNFFRPILEEKRDLLTGTSSYEASTYNNLGEVVFKSFPSTTKIISQGTGFTYDGLGRLKAERETVSPYATVKHNYGAYHRHEIIDALGKSTKYYYTGYGGPDDNSELRHINQPLGVSTYLIRNVWGEITRLQQYGNQNGISVNHNQNFYYDNNRRLCRHRTAEGGDTLFAYDAAGRLAAYQKGAPYGISCNAPSGIGKVTLSRDKIGRVILTNFADPATPYINTSYDKNGNVVRQYRSGGSRWAYTYDELNQLTSENLLIDGRSYNQTYSYDTSQFMTRHTLPSGRTLDYNHDGLGRVKTIKSDNTTYADNISYHVNDALARLTYGNGHTFTQSLNNRLKPYTLRSQKGSVKALDLRYSYDKRGLVTTMTDGVNSANSRVYGYDDLGRLINASGPWGNGSFIYDALGNLRQKKLGTRTVDVRYDSKNRATRSTDSAGITRQIRYDGRGNVSGLGALSFVYDKTDQPTSVSGGLTGTYEYDGNLKRVKSFVGGKTIYNVYNASGKLVHVDAVTENTKTDYVANFLRITNDIPTYLHRDHLGSPVAGTDSSGAILWTEQYTPFGEKMIDNSANNDLGGFTGHVDDNATGLTYMQARYYDPIIGRFLSIDPVGFSPSKPYMFNRYSYVGNNPVNFVDPFGMDDNDQPDPSDDEDEEDKNKARDEEEEVIVYGNKNPAQLEFEKSIGMTKKQFLDGAANDTIIEQLETRQRVRAKLESLEKKKAALLKATIAQALRKAKTKVKPKEADADLKMTAKNSEVITMMLLDANPWMRLIPKSLITRLAARQGAAIVAGMENDRLDAAREVSQPSN